MQRMNLFWLESRAAELPADLDWLSSAEVARYRAFRFPKRSADWLLGRWTAKRALASYFSSTASKPMLREIEIRPTASGAPEVYVSGALVMASISITHSAGRAMCTIGPATVSVGCDMETVEPRSNAFVHDFFTPEEMNIVEACRDENARELSINLIWSAKESALKAMRLGLQIDTRSVVASFSNENVAGTKWRSLRVVGANDQCFKGWWLRSGLWVMTILATQPSGPPVSIHALNPPAYSDRLAVASRTKSGRSC